MPSQHGKSPRYSDRVTIPRTGMPSIVKYNLETETTVADARTRKHTHEVEKTLRCRVSVAGQVDNGCRIDPCPSSLRLERISLQRTATCFSQLTNTLIMVVNTSIDESRECETAVKLLICIIVALSQAFVTNSYFGIRGLWAWIYR